MTQAVERSATTAGRPGATYRLQFHAGFTFHDAAQVVPYLAELGVTHVYASPYLRARAGSTHGYDVVGHGELNPEMGTEGDFEAFVAALHAHGMGQVLDIVPNHMGVATNDNAWWNDVLMHGPSSRYAEWFDIAWDRGPRPEMCGRVLLPVLGDVYGNVLDRGEIKLSWEGAAPAVCYYDRRFPIDPASAAALSAHDVEAINADRQVKRVRIAAAGQVPVLVGSGITARTIDQYLPHADGFIVGTSLKRDGRVENPVEPGRVRELMARVR